MDKQEYREFLEEIKTGYEAGDYDRVVMYADEIDVNKIKEPRILELISDSYIRKGNYNAARDALFAAYQKAGSGRQIVYKLSELSIAVGDLDSAVEFYEDYCKLAKGDSKRYILKYEIGKAGGVPKSELIKVLEAYLSHEKDEKWQYELARLYHETGQDAKCVACCDDIYLWYAGGEYVKKALELKFSHAALSPEQQASYEEMMSAYMHPYAAAAEEPEEAYEEEPAEEEAPKAVKNEEASAEETRVIPIRELLDELEGLGTKAGIEAYTEELAEEFLPSEDPDIEQPDTEAEEIPEEEAEEVPEEAEDEYKPETITMDQLRTMIREGNKNKASAGVFFKMEEVTAEDIAEEEALKAAREVERKLAEEAAAQKAEAEARKLAEEETARIAAAVAVVGDAEEVPAQEAAPEEGMIDTSKLFDEADEELGGETRVISRAELFARLNGLENGTQPSQPTQAFPKQSDSVFASRPAVIERERTPQEELSAAIAGIMNDADALIEETAESEGKLVPVGYSDAGKIGSSTALLSAHAAFVSKPELKKFKTEGLSREVQELLGIQPPRILENVDISYMSLASDEDGQLGLRLDVPVQEDDENIEGQMSFFDLGRQNEKNEAAPEITDVAVERLRQIQEAVNIDSEVVLPYDMEDPYFDDIEVVDTDSVSATTAIPKEVIAAALAGGAVGAAEEIMTEAEETELPEAEETGLTEKKLPEVDEELDVVLGGEEAEEEPLEEEEPTEEEASAEEELAEEAASVETEETPAEDEELSEEPEEPSEAEKAIAKFDEDYSPEELDDDELQKFDEFESSLVSMMTDEESENTEDAEADELETELKTADDDYAEYDNDEETFSLDVDLAAAKQYSDPTGYVMPDEIRDEMSEFLLIEGMESAITGAIASIVNAKKSGDRTGGNLVITGDTKSGKTYLSIALIKAVAQELQEGNGRVAKIQAETLNGKSMERVFEKVRGCDLIIEGVGNFEDYTIRDLTEILDEGISDGMVVLEGNQLAVENIFSNFPELAKHFTNRIDINELSIVQWADIAINYAQQKGYVLDDMAKLALHAKIDEINVPTSRLGYDNILDIMDNAMARADKRNVGRLFAAFKKKNDEIKEIIESDIR